MKPDGEVTSWSNRQNQLFAQESSLSQNHVASGPFSQIPSGQMSQIPMTNIQEFPTAQPNTPIQARCMYLNLKKKNYLQCLTLLTFT